jgi:hypothetical protein
MSALLRGVGGGISAVLVVAGTIAAVVAIGFGVWWFGVRTSGVIGSGQITKDQNSSQNREYWSAKYAADWQNLQADQSSLASLKADAAAPGATQQDRQNFQGAQLNCDTDVATYNTDTANVLGHRFIPAGQPTTVTATTFCGS